MLYRLLVKESFDVLEKQLLSKKDPNLLSAIIVLVFFNGFICILIGSF